MVRNTFIPLLLITATTIGAIYVWFDETFLSSLLPMMAFICLVLGSLYVSFFFAFKFFPSEHNRCLPAVNKLPAFFTAECNKFGSKPFITGSFLTALLIFLGLHLWTELASTFKDYQLNRFGRTTKAYVTDVGYEKDFGTYREFEFIDEKGTTYKSRFLNSSIAPGSSIVIKYSIKKPTITEVVWPVAAEK